MSQSHSENGSTPEILGHLEAYEEMSEQCQRIASLRENVEKERQSVQSHIYEKVKAEYEQKMLAVEQDLKRQKDLLEEKVKDLLDKRSDLDKLCQKDAERLEEIDFRTRVGEFTEEECKEERNEIEQRSQGQTKELARLDEIVDRCTKSGLLSEQAPSAPPMPAAEAKTQEPQAEKPEPEKATTPPPEIEEASIEEASEEAEAPETAAAEIEEDFEIVEQDPVAEDAEAPVVHCPPNLSSGKMKARKDSATSAGRSGPNAEVSEYVTGYLVALEGSRQGERFPMISSNITLGSSPGIDIRLNDSGIANFHARILYKERKHFLENLDSVGRSFVNGVQATDVVELKDGDVIRLGDIKMQVEYASSKTTAAI